MTKEIEVTVHEDPDCEGVTFSVMTCQCGHVFDLVNYGLVCPFCGVTYELFAREKYKREMQVLVEAGRIVQDLGAQDILQAQQILTLRQPLKAEFTPEAKERLRADLAAEKADIEGENA